MSESNEMVTEDKGVVCESVESNESLDVTIAKSVPIPIDEEWEWVCEGGIVQGNTMPIIG
ncbi:MAG: hypothetical protein US31_C0007G0025 [Berkelbacteria bacterium GW2011_GWA1_36_9]|uniref:Uncharacterized protein n=1 Tax=Berkelbacteria bacterium GW2011_GWA1_36_9 TaxID=1618331 RepID=A0A0G0I1U5_9BACT|nr:MAG: hypothetical protein US31_C0007G0025 [Berkelbacteria bacterium GW2011_GWA1_36_9]